MTIRTTDAWGMSGRIDNLYGAMKLERQVGAPLLMATHDIVRLRMSPALGHQFWMVALPWKKRKPRDEAGRSIRSIEQEPYGSLNGFNLLRPVLDETEKAMLHDLREMLRVIPEGEMVHFENEGFLTEDIDGARGGVHFKIVTWPVAVVASVIYPDLLNTLLVPAGKLPEVGHTKLVTYHGLVQVRDLLDGLSTEATEQGGGWLSP